jgi:hypothetical protein
MGTPFWTGTGAMSRAYFIERSLRGNACSKQSKEIELQNEKENRASKESWVRVETRIIPSCPGKISRNALSCSKKENRPKKKQKLTFCPAWRFASAAARP